MQRTLIIIATVIVVMGAGVAGYFYFSSKNAGITVAPGGGTTTFPSGGQNITPVTGQLDTPAMPVTGSNNIPTRLVKISIGPVVPGVAVVDMPAPGASSSTPSSSLGGGDVAVNYIERQSGNVFSYRTHAGGITRTSNRTIPGIETAAWLPDATVAFVRYLSGSDFSTVNTYGLVADGSSGFFLPQGISDLATASSSVLTVVSGVNGSAASVAQADGTHASAVFTSPLSSLRASFAGATRYLAFTKPSASLLGDAFIVDAKGSFSRIAGPLRGLVALASHSGTWVLVTYSQSGVMHTELVNTETGERIPLPVATIANKCVWTANDTSVYCGIPIDPSANFDYPDDWYQGAMQFSDRIWKIDVAGRFAQLVLDFPKETNGPLDAIALAIDPAGTTLAFVNKIDGSLWGYAL